MTNPDTFPDEAAADQPVIGERIALTQAQIAERYPGMSVYMAFSLHREIDLYLNLSRLSN